MFCFHKIAEKLDLNLYRPLRALAKLPCTYPYALTGLSPGRKEQTTFLIYSIAGRHAKRYVAHYEPSRLQRYRRNNGRGCTDSVLEIPKLKHCTSSGQSPAGISRR